MQSATLRAIPGWPCYFASDDGRIWTTKRKGGNDRIPGRTGSPRRLTLQTGRHGYLTVNLDVAGQNVSRFVHQLVLEAFVGPCPEGMEACHYPDPDKANNRPSNLRWDTHDENIRDNYRDRVAATEKACRRCLVVKPVADFYGDTRASDGLKGECKACHAAVSIATRDPEKKRAANREFMRRKRATGG